MSRTTQEEIDESINDLRKYAERKGGFTDDEQKKMTDFLKTVKTPEQIREEIEQIQEESCLDGIL